MGYRTLKACVDDLHRAGHLQVVDEPVDPNLEMAEIQRRVYRAGGPALLFTNVVGCRFPMVSNLFGTMERARYIFRDTIDDVRRAIDLKVHPERALRQPLKYWKAPFVAWRMRPRYVRRAPVLRHHVKVSELPGLVSWPRDGGPFITLPLVYTEDVEHPGWQHSNLGMYRVQLSGNDYVSDREVGLHYQIHRGIGVHHQAAIAAGKPFRVNIFVGGTPAMTLAAVMPLPEGMSELTFAGALAGHRIPLVRQPDGPAVYAQADFCISGTVIPNVLKPEGPFGDHLGYYSLQHEFPVLKVERVTHRPGAIWPFTVVGRPPQEDTVFGQLIHDLTGDVIPTVLPGVKAVNAVDAAGVHPLLLALGSERYTPYQPIERPQELLTQANAILGQGQLSLAKYLWIIDSVSVPEANVNDVGDFFQHVLRRVDWRRDLHFQTQTTIDTLDYSGDAINRGSKLVIAAAGAERRELKAHVPTDLRLPDGFCDPRVVMPGVLAVRSPAWSPSGATSLRAFCAAFETNERLGGADDHLSWRDTGPGDEPARGANDQGPFAGFPLIVLCDDAAFTANSIDNFVWVTFTRSNPATDTDGIGAMLRHRHWGCRGPLVIDARMKPHHAPPLEPDPSVTRRVDQMLRRLGLDCPSK